VQEPLAQEPLAQELLLVSCFGYSIGLIGFETGSARSLQESRLGDRLRELDLHLTIDCVTRCQWRRGGEVQWVD